MQELLGTIGQVRPIDIITTIDMTITTRTFLFASFKSKQQLTILRLLLRRAFVQYARRRRRGGWSATYIQVFALITQQTKKELSPLKTPSKMEGHSGEYGNAAKLVGKMSK